MAANIRKQSRLRFGNLITIGPFEFWDVLHLPAFPSDVGDTFYTVKTGDRLDYLAFKLYGDPIYWWVLAVANDMEILPTDLQEGMRMRVPSAAFVQQVFFTQANN